MRPRTYSWHDSHLLCALAATACLLGIGAFVALVWIVILLMVNYPLFRALMLPLIFWLALYSVFRRP